MKTELMKSELIWCYLVDKVLLRDGVLVMMVLIGGVVSCIAFDYYFNPPMTSASDEFVYLPVLVIGIVISAFITFMWARFIRLVTKIFFSNCLLKLFIE